MGIRVALSAIPSKPLIAAAIGFTAFAASWHGWNVRSNLLRLSGSNL